MQKLGAVYFQRPHLQQEISRNGKGTQRNKINLQNQPKVAKVSDFNYKDFKMTLNMPSEPQKIADISPNQDEQHENTNKINKM